MAEYMEERRFRGTREMNKVLERNARGVSWKRG